MEIWSQGRLRWWVGRGGVLCDVKLAREVSVTKVLWYVFVLQLKWSHVNTAGNVSVVPALKDRNARGPDDLFSIWHSREGSFFIFSHLLWRLAKPSRIPQKIRFCSYMTCTSPPLTYLIIIREIRIERNGSKFILSLGRVVAIWMLDTQTLKKLLCISSVANRSNQSGLSRIWPVSTALFWKDKESAPSVAARGEKSFSATSFRQLTAFCASVHLSPIRWSVPSISTTRSLCCCRQSRPH